MNLELTDESITKISESNVLNMVQSIIGNLPPEFSEQLGPILEDMILGILEDNPNISMDELIEELDYRLENIIEQGPSEQELNKMVEEDDSDFVNKFLGDDLGLTEEQTKLWDDIWPGTR